MDTADATCVYLAGTFLTGNHFMTMKKMTHFQIDSVTAVARASSVLQQIYDTSCVGAKQNHVRLITS